MNEQLQWRIYYGDGSTFDSSMGSPSEAPARDVQAIVQPDEQAGRVVISKWDYYYWQERGCWYGCDIFGLFDYLCRPGWKTVKFGRTLLNDEYTAIFVRAAEDPGFPRKSAKYEGE